MGSAPDQLALVAETVADAVTEFTGRGRELAAVRSAAWNAATLITGMAGVGKTELALRSAAPLRSDRAGLSALFVNLRGFEPDGAPPLAPGAVLVSILRLLGERDHRWHADDVDALIGECRQRFAARPYLVVFDNAGDERQVAPLLAATTRARVLVTSRLTMPGVDAGRAVQRIELEPFTEAEALELFRRTAGAARIDGERESALEIVRAHGRLPLSLGITARRIAERTDWTLAELADQLRQRLAGLRLEPDVDASLALSYQGLSVDDQRFLRLLALHPAHLLDAPAAAALAGQDVASAGERLAFLADRHLLQRSGPETYGLHDLVRAQLIAASVDEDRPTDRSAAVARLLDHYRNAALIMIAELGPPDPEMADLPLLTGDPSARPWLSDAARTPAGRVAALAWLDAKAATFVALIQSEHAYEHAKATVALVLVLAPYLRLRADLQVVLDLHLRARDAAERHGDPVVIALTERQIGGTWLRIGDLAAGRQHLTAAADLFAATDHDLGLAQAISSLAIVDAEGGDHRKAVDGFRAAQRIYQRHGLERAVRVVANNLAVAQVHTGELAERLAHFEREIATCLEKSEHDREIIARTNAASFCLQLGRFAEARDHAERGLALCRQLGDRIGEAYLEQNLAEALAASGDVDEAARRLGAAFELAQELGDRGLEVHLHRTAGVADCYRGDLDDAERAFTTARDIAAELSDQLSVAAADEGLAAVACARGDRDTAHDLWTRAGDRYRAASLPEAARVAAHLARLDAGDDCGCRRPDSPLVIDRALTRV
ncbi:tetratricopeptide repeat protein [Jiangella alkaliphila]|nr:tetratricopeptide repeat protein [Jiangella alkaliphila]